MSDLISAFWFRGGVVTGLLAAASFSPVFKKDFLYRAIVVAVAMGVYSLGVSDEKANRDAQQRAEQATVDKAVTDALAKNRRQGPPMIDPRN